MKEQITSTTSLYKISDLRAYFLNDFAVLCLHFLFQQTSHLCSHHDIDLHFKSHGHPFSCAYLRQSK